MKHKNYSPLRYPGGKAKLSPYLQKIIDQNHFKKPVYVEPFAGGAGVALSLLFNEVVSNIIINDLDYSIYAFWYAVLNRTDELCTLVSETPIDLETWYIQRNIIDHQSEYSILEVGFALLFLNRTNRSGIIKAGVIGGKNQDGNYKIDCRFNRTDLVSRIRKIASYSDKITLFNLDASELIDDVIKKQNSNTIVYFDPPYFNMGSKLYTSFYTENDHFELSRSISEISNCSWIVTYDYVNEIRELYRSYRQIPFGLKYSVEKKYTGYEILVLSDSIETYDENVLL